MLALTPHSPGSTMTRMETAALWRIAHDPDTLPHLAQIALIALDGREPTADDDRALGDAIDVWLYTEELGT